MLNLNQLLAILISGLLMVSCEKEESNPLCAEPGGDRIEDRIGQIYKENDFYYISRINATGRGGRIPCAPLPDKYRKIGMKIIYSGIMNYPDNTDPLYGFIKITEIKEYKE